jgi:hypothetical protein
MILDTKAGLFCVKGLAGLLGLALTQCGPGVGGEPTATSGQAIVGGGEAGVLESPVLYLEGPQGTCTSILVAPNLVATARHCTAQLVEGNASCTPEGDLTPTGSGAGEIGADDAPSSLNFFSAATIANAGAAGPADAVGIKILSTQGPSICCDDLAFVVLDHPIAGLVPVSIRIDGPTQVGESVSVFGYGLTDRSMAPTLLRVRPDAEIVGVGPDDPTSVPQAAPLRALRVGPGVVTCNGDSGGPVISTASGALIGLVSLGTQANSMGLFCSDGTAANTTGPDLADYRDLVLAAFAEAGASPILEVFPSDAGEEGSEEAGQVERKEAGPPVQGNGVPPSGPVEFVAAGGSCATTLEPKDGSCPSGAIACGLAMMTVAVGRRRR